MGRGAVDPVVMGVVYDGPLVIRANIQDKMKDDYFKARTVNM